MLISAMPRASNWVLRRCLSRRCLWRPPAYAGRWRFAVGRGRTVCGQYKQAAKFVSSCCLRKCKIELVRVYGGLPLTPGGSRCRARSKIAQGWRQTLEVAYASLNGKGSSAEPCGWPISIRCALSPMRNWRPSGPTRSRPRRRSMPRSAVVTRCWQCQAGSEEGAALLMNAAAALDCPSRWRIAGAGKHAGRHPAGGPPGLPSGRVRCHVRGWHARSYSRRNAGADDQWRYRPVCETPDARSFRSMPGTASAFRALPKRRAVPRTRLAGQCRDQAGDRPRIGDGRGGFRD
jgi:hypothetical protein